MKLHLGDIDFETGDDKDRIHAIIKNLFWLLLAWILLSMLRPQTAATWIKYYKKKAGELKASWGTKVARWASLALDTITDWGTWLLEGGLTLIRWTLITCAVLLGLYLIVGLGYLPVLAPALTVAVAVAALLLVLAVQIIPGALLPGNKQRTREVFGVMGMWPIAICFAFVCFPFTWTGTFIWMVVLMGLFYLLKGGQIRFARIAASVVLWSAVLFKAVEFGLPAVEAGTFGGAASEIAGKVMNWDDLRGKAGDIQAEEHRVQVSQTRGVAVDTIRTVVLKMTNGTTQRVGYVIAPGELLEVMVGLDTLEWNTGFRIPVKLVRLMDTDAMDRFVDTYNAAEFYVPWGKVQADESISAYQGGAASATLTDEPPYLSVSGISGSKRVQYSIPLADVKPAAAADGGMTFKLYGRQAQGYRVPINLKPGEAVEVQVTGSVGFNLIDGEPDPAMKGMNTGFVGPEGFGQSEASSFWDSKGILTVSQANYGGLLWSAVRDGSTLSPAADSFGYGYLEIDQPTRYLYFVLNDIWYGRGRSGKDMTLADQVTSRAGELTVTLTRISDDAEGSDAAANL